MKLEKIHSTPQDTPSLSSELKSIINGKSYAEWNGKIYSTVPSVLTRMINTIEAAWNAKSIRPERVKKQLLLNDVTKTVTIIKTMKNRLQKNPTIDLEQGASLINIAQAKVIHLAKALEKISDKKDEPFIRNQQSILETFAGDLTVLQNRIPILELGNQKRFHDNLKTFFSVDITDNAQQDILDFIETIHKSLNRPPEQPILINEKSLGEVSQKIPDPRIRLIEIHHEQDPVKKLMLFTTFVGKDILEDGFGVTSQNRAADQFLQAVESLFREYPDESLLLISDFLSINPDKYTDLVDDKLTVATDEKTKVEISLTKYTLTTLFSMVSFLYDTEERNS